MQNTFSPPRSLASVFQNCANTFADNIAIECGGIRLTYLELDRVSDAFSLQLVRAGVKSGDIVGLPVVRGVDPIVRLLAIIKTGAAYLPLDSHQSPERNRQIAIGAGLRHTAGELSDLADLDIHQIVLEATSEPVEVPRAVQPSSPDAPAYVLYTSGSTGTPKGVMVPHRAILRLVYGQTFMNLGPEERILQNSPMTFDAATLEIWGALLNGGTLVIPENTDGSLRSLGETIRRKNITTLWLTAGLFHAVADERPQDFAAVRQLITGGDIVSPARVAQVLSVCPGIQIINGYGPTENTTFTTCHHITLSEALSGLPLPIGRAIDGTEIYVVDEALELVEQGVEGELCVAGSGLALGYLGQPDVTRAKFVAAPWDPSLRLYRTGDLVREAEPGLLHFLGRIDNQIKLRGFRIEPGEIEAALDAHPFIRKSAVIARVSTDQTDKMLHAFCVVTEGYDEAQVRADVAKRLPSYAMPTRLIVLDTLPLTLNGKIDRKVLAETSPGKTNLRRKAPLPAKPNIEDMIARLLAETLGQSAEEISAKSNFFDLGASSLHLARVHERLQTALNRSFPMADFFRYSTVETLAAHLTGSPRKVTDHHRDVSLSRHAGQGLIAIVGMAGRFPGAPDVQSFWTALVEGRELISHFNAEELDVDPRQHHPDASFVLARGVMNDADLFDARHFGIPPREAERLDPQHRILLELAQTALETSGHDPERFPGQIGIFAGTSQNSYLLNNLLSAPGASREFAAGYPVENFATLFGNDKDFIATRIAYKLNLRGPAVNVQCACSTSLVAVAEACNSLRNGSSDMALAGGVSVTFPTRRPYRYMPDGMASADGHCRTFDADATGTVFGDGAGLVVLRRLEDALADGDEIIAVIRGFAVNNDGSDKAGFAAPSVRAQAEVIRAAHEAAGVGPRSIGYVEAHGTATPLGDPIEFAALTEAFASGTDEKGFCALGSAKTNVGHLDIAAGITGLIKTALSLKNEFIPQLVHFRAPNPRLDFAGSAFYPAATAMPWQRSKTPRRAGVSAFGVGGTNVHMILEEAPDQPPPARSETHKGPRVFPVSASSQDALKRAVADLGTWALANPAADADATASTLSRGRRVFGERAFLVASDIPALARSALSFSGKGITAGRRSAVAFLFPGQGSQHLGMARDLFAAEPVFRDAMMQCSTLLSPHLGLNLLEVIYPKGGDENSAAERLKDTTLAQPAIFSIGYALARQWQHWGVSADVLVGHSVGEFVAATIAGVFDLPDALKLIALRGRLMGGLPGGVMVSVRASEEALQPFLGAGLDLASVNGAKACVLAGPEHAAEAILPSLESAGFVASRLLTSHAFHSHMMDDAIEPFRQAVAASSLRAPSIPIVSTVTGDWLTPSEATDPDYWAMHMRRPVRFHSALQMLWAENRHIFLETGPGRTLSALAGQKPDRSTIQPSLASLPHAQSENADSDYSMIEAFGSLWAHGLPVDWNLLDREGPKPARQSGLPTYPFQRKRFWIEPDDAAVRTQPEQAERVTSPPPEPINEVQATDALREMFSDLSGIDPSEMDATATFLNLGFDSLMLTQATRELACRFGLAIKLRELIDRYPTINALARHLNANGTLPGDTAPNLSSIAPSVSDTRPTETPSAPLTQIISDAEALSPLQSAHIVALVARYTAKTAKSKQLTASFRPYHADPRTASGFNRHWKEIVYQIVTVKSKGSRLIDVDGNEYIDILNGFGPGFLGHSPEPVVSALHAQIDQGIEVGPQSLAAMEAAQLFCEVTGNDRASFVCTGSEAVYAAIRLARTCTGRDRIVMFARDYHGNFDEVLVRGVAGKDGPVTFPLAPGIPRDAVKNVVVLPYGTPEALDWINANADSIAAVIVEPVQSRRPEFRPAEFVREVRRITERSGSLFIFDEVVTGFRFGLRGAQGYYGVEADLVTYGKIVGGGMPVGVVSGKARYMDTFDGGQWQYGDDSFPEAPVTFFAGTFVRHPLAMASVRAMLLHLWQKPDLFWTAINTKGDRLAGSIDRWCEQNDMPFRMPNCGSLMYLRIGDDQKYGSLIGAHLRDRGVFMLEGFPSYMTAAHDDADIDHVVDAFKDSALELRSAGLLSGREEITYSPVLPKVPARLTLPGGEESIAQAMAAPMQALAVPVTEAQREILMALAVSPEINPAYNESVTLTLQGTVDRGALQNSVIQVIRRHDALRSVFPKDQMEMLISPEIEIDVPVVDLSSLSVSEQTSALRERIETEVTKPFDLVVGPLVRAQIIACSSNLTRLVITAHHIVCDGWSISLLLSEISQAYRTLNENHEPGKVPSQSIVAYAQAEADWARTAEAANSRAFWANEFSGDIPVLDLPTDFTRSPVASGRGARVDRTLPTVLTESLRKFARSQGATFANLILAAYAVHVARLAEIDNLVLGMPTAGQAAWDTPRVVGHCVNLLPIRVSVDTTAGFDRVLSAVQSTLLDALEHQKVTFGEIVRGLRIPRQSGRVPLVPVIFNIDIGIDPKTLGFGEVHAELTTNPRAFEHFELYLNVTDKAEQVTTEWSYRTDLFAQSTIERWIDQFEALLVSIINAPTQPLDALDALATTERQLLLTEFQGARTEFARDATIASLFDRRVAANPDAVALISENGSITSYRDLDALVHIIAARLAVRGVEPGDIVGVCMTRSPEMVATMLAVMRLGAAFLPLDPGNPAERLRLIIEDSSPKVIVSRHEISNRLALSETELLNDVSQFEIASFQTVPLVAPAPAGAAYVIYTSGSTGQPKGVVGTHLATINRFIWMWRSFAFGPHEVACQKMAISFVDSIWEIFGPLLAGVPQVIVPDTTVRDPRAFLNLLAANDVTRLLVVPSQLQMFAEAGVSLAEAAPKLRLIFTSGERLTEDLTRRTLANAPDVTLVNLYGSSEVAADVTYQIVDPNLQGAVPIGAAIDNVRLYVLDENHRLRPCGEIGELFVGGDAVAAGYLHRPNLTKERFHTDPFSSEPGARMFATGDMVRWLPDGRLMYEGRRDHQIKIRGYRVELGEVESHVVALPEVSEALAILHENDAAGPQLVAFVVGRSGATVVPHLMRKALGERLPNYMIPERIILLPSLPLNTSGKLDRALLSTWPLDATTEIAVSPNDSTNEIEQKLLGIWRDLLRQPNIAADDGFFALGGHSLLAVSLFTAIRKQFEVDLPISTLFSHPTVRSLAAHLISLGWQTDKLQESSPGASRLPAKTVKMEDESWDTTVVVHAGPGNDALPLFMVGGVGGNVNNMFELGQRIGLTRPLIGLQTRGILGHKMHGSIEAMATDHLSHIRRRQPHGPYLISGYSGGGFPALEIARQLASAGEEVAYLGILDMYAPGFAVTEKGTRSNRIRYELGVLFDRGPTMLLARGWKSLRNRFLFRHSAKIYEQPKPGPAPYEYIMRHWCRIIPLYQPNPYSGDMNLYLTTGDGYVDFRLRQRDPMLGWPALIDGQVKTRALAGGHLGVLKGSSAAALGTMIETDIELCLNRQDGA